MVNDNYAIIGINNDGIAGLSDRARQRIAQADLIIGVERTLTLLRQGVSATAKLRAMDGVLLKSVEWIAQGVAAKEQVVLIVNGDPLCHSVAPLIIKRLPDLRVEIFPAHSALQLAFARFAMNANSFRTISIHGRDAGEWQSGAPPSHGLYSLLQALHRGESLALFTSPDNSPQRVARMLTLEGMDAGWQMAVGSHLLADDEQLVGPLAVSEMVNHPPIAHPNVLLIWRETAPPCPPPLFALPDSSFAQRTPDRGLITRRDIRAMVLGRLQLRRDSTVWDIGAGSGAVGLEAAQICSEGHVYAVEKNGEDCANIEANRRQLQITNYSWLEARAPQGLASWGDPDAVFIGGSGGEMVALIELALARLRPAGVLVITLVTLENLELARATFNRLKVAFELTQVTLAHAAPILEMQRLRGENPLWLLTASKVVEVSNVSGD
ncbi:MAG: precorrin-6y C5,15-methyltransferase (decarboxylating) subunit CbiE [Gammaproteobacteria bacterium]|nr:precorrin-6y C5,15-methyltransferase (decarboxylating) subunit CbiE [Gammaproteobacteria bacterium]